MHGLPHAHAVSNKRLLYILRGGTNAVALPGKRNQRKIRNRRRAWLSRLALDKKNSLQTVFVSGLAGLACNNTIVLLVYHTYRPPRDSAD